MHFPAWVVEQNLEQVCRAYYMAKDRCNNSNNKDYARYGGRGIEFKLPKLKLVLEAIGPRPIGYTLDRKDNNKHYELGNVQWASPSQQARNRCDSITRTDSKGIYARSTGWVVVIHGKYYGFRKTFDAAKQLKEQCNATLF